MKNPASVALCVCATLALPFAAHAVSGDEHWDNQFNWPGTGGLVAAVTSHNGQIYASAGASSTNVAIDLFDGMQWSALAQASGSSSTFVYDMTFVGNNLYVAGIFTNVNGVAITNLAKW